MALRKPLVIINGVPQQISNSDTLDAVLAEVDQVSLSNGEATAVVIGTPAYVFSANTVKKAQANASGTTEAIGLIRDTSIAAGATGSVQLDGQLSATTAQWDAITGGTGGLTAGSTYYLSASTSGQLTTVAPTTTGQFVLRIGKALSTTVLDIAIGQLFGL